MAFSLYVFFGIVIALLARRVLYGCRKLSIVLVLWLSIAGALLGGLGASFVMLQRVTEFHATGIVGSLAGALLGLAAGGAFRRKAAAAPPKGPARGRPRQASIDSEVTSQSAPSSALVAQP